MATEPIPSTETQTDLSYAKRTLILFGLVVLTVFYVEIMMAPSTPKILIQYKVTLGETSLILALYTVFGTAVTPIIGKLGDIYGKKKILTYVLIVYSIMVVATSFTQNFTWLLVSRTFQGIGLAIIPLAFSLAREGFPREWIPRAQALISGMVFAGIGLGLSAGSFVSNYYGWQANYHLATPVIILLSALIIYGVRESSFKNPKARLDYFGSSFLGVSLAMIVLGISQGSSWGWTSTPIVVLLLGGSFLLIPLILVERKVEEPLLDFSQLRLRNIVVANILAFTSGLAIVLSFSSLVYKLEDAKPAGYGFGILTAGLYILPFALVVLLVSFPLGILNSRYGSKPFLVVGSAIGAIGSILLADENTSVQIPEFISIAALGFAMIIVSRQILLVLSVNPKEMGSLISINQVFFNVGQSFGPAISASILSTYATTVIFEGHPFTLPTSVAFQYTFWVVTGVFLLSLIVALFAKEVIAKKTQIARSAESLGKTP